MFWSLVLLLTFFVTFLTVPDRGISLEEMHRNPQVASVVQSKPDFEYATITFVGDIMLGRHVESIILEQSVPYVFENMKTIIRDADYTIGNFEGIISQEHIQTPWMGFRFSVRNKYLTELRELGFDMLSLANNHSYDFGDDALNYTRTICREIKIRCIGDPHAVNESSSRIVEIDSTHVGFFALQTVSASYSDIELKKMSTYLNAGSDIQVAYVHWGDEYVLTHNETQRKLAHTLIDLGFDVVIGHHPHVVQDVELYKGKPIFYSLGNFVFDQYFDTNVQEGLVLQMEVHEDVLRYLLFPITSVDTKTQPDFMGTERRHDMLMRVLQNIESDSAVVDTKAGVLTITRN